MARHVHRAAERAGGSPANVHARGPRAGHRKIHREADKRDEHHRQIGICREGRGHEQSRGRRHRAGSKPPPRAADPDPPGQWRREPAGRERAEAAEKERQAGEHRARLEVELPDLEEVCRKPGDEEIPRIAHRGILSAEAPDRAGCRHPPPGHVKMIASGGRRRQHRGLGGVDARMRPRVVAIPPGEDDRPSDTGHAEDEKCLPPGHRREAGVDEQRRDRAPPAGAHPHNALRPRPLRGRHPPVERLREVGEAARLTRAEEKPRDDKRGEAPGPARGRGEEAPPEHDPQEHLAGADPVAEIAAGNLEEGVGEREGGKYPAHLLLREREVLHHHGRGLRDGHAVDILQHREGDGEYDHDPAGVRWPHGSTRFVRHGRDYAACGGCGQAGHGGYGAVEVCIFCGQVRGA